MDFLETPEDIAGQLEVVQRQLRVFEDEVSSELLLERLRTSSPYHPALIARLALFVAAFSSALGAIGVAILPFIMDPLPYILLKFEQNRGGIPLPLIFIVITTCLGFAYFLAGQAAYLYAKSCPLLPNEQREHDRLQNEIQRLSSQKAIMDRVRATPTGARPRTSTPASNRSTHSPLASTSGSFTPQGSPIPRNLVATLRSDISGSRERISITPPPVSQNVNRFARSTPSHVEPGALPLPHVVQQASPIGPVKRSGELGNRRRNGPGFTPPPAPGRFTPPPTPGHDKPRYTSPQRYEVEENHSNTEVDATERLVYEESRSTSLVYEEAPPAHQRFASFDSSDADEKTQVIRLEEPDESPMSDEIPVAMTLSVNAAHSDYEIAATESYSRNAADSLSSTRSYLGFEQRYASHFPKWDNVQDSWLEEAIQQAELLAQSFPVQAHLEFSPEPHLPFVLILERATPAMAVRTMVSYVEFLASISTPPRGRITLRQVPNLDRNFYRNVEAALEPHFGKQTHVVAEANSIEIEFTDWDKAWDEHPYLPMNNL